MQASSDASLLTYFALSLKLRFKGVFLQMNLTRSKMSLYSYSGKLYKTLINNRFKKRWEKEVLMDRETRIFGVILVGMCVCGIGIAVNHVPTALCI